MNCRFGTLHSIDASVSRHVSTVSWPRSSTHNRFAGLCVEYPEDIPHPLDAEHATSLFSSPGYVWNIRKTHLIPSAHCTPSTRRSPDTSQPFRGLAPQHTTASLGCALNIRKISLIRSTQNTQHHCSLHCPFDTTIRTQKGSAGIRRCLTSSSSGEINPSPLPSYRPQRTWPPKPSSCNRPSCRQFASLSMHPSCAGIHQSLPEEHATYHEH